MANESLFGHIAFARNATLNSIKDVAPKNALIIPEGFSNNILWNLGHIYSALERFALKRSQGYREHKRHSRS